MLKKASKLKEIYFSLNIQMFANRKNKWINKKEMIVSNVTLESEYYFDDTINVRNNIDYKKTATINYAEFVDIHGKKYYINNDNKIIHEFNEISVAEWIRDYLHLDVEYLPNISEDDSIKLGDYKINNKDVWELKTIRGNGKRTLDTAVKDKKEQANIFILDLTYSEMGNSEAIKQTIDIFRKREWIEKIILKRNNNILKVFKKKRN